MCKNFSVVAMDTVASATQERPIRWTEPDLLSPRHSHEDVIERLGLRDAGLGRFYRLECPPPFDLVDLDDDTQAGEEFWNDHGDSITPRVIALAQQVARVRADFVVEMRAALERMDDERERLDAGQSEYWYALVGALDERERQEGTSSITFYTLRDAHGDRRSAALNAFDTELHWLLACQHAQRAIITHHYVDALRGIEGYAPEVVG